MKRFSSKKWSLRVGTGAIALSFLSQGLFPLITLAQQPPQSELLFNLSSENNPPGEVPPPVTFDEENPIPPRGYTPEPFNNNPSNQFNQYRLSFGDSISVAVANFQEFTLPRTIVDVEGKIVMPIAGPIYLTGLTVEEARSKIAYELGTRFLRQQPDVIVTLLAPAQPTITVAGEVVTPGYYQVPAGADLADAIQFARGTTDQADLRSIIVRRKLVDGTFIEQKVDLITPLLNGTSLPPLILQHGDAIIVAKLEVGETQDYDSILASRSSLAKEIITVRVLDYSQKGLRALELRNGSTFLDALAAVNTNSDDANLRRIALIRFDREQGRAVSQYLNGRDALMGDVSQNVPLRDNDIIIVNRSLIAKLSYGLNLFTRPFRDILGFLLFFQELSNSADSLFNPTGGSDTNQN